MITGAETEGPLAVSDGQAGVDAELEDHAAGARSVRAALGPDAFESAAALGAAMTYDEVAEYTLGELERLLAEARSL